MSDPAVQDKWARNTGAVGLEAWRAAMDNYGIARVAQGAQAKSGKFEKAMESLLPFIDNLRNTVRQMDDSTPAAREQRAIAMMRGMRNYRRPAN
jgi:molecular chaperone GrpE (heat shock protein)